MRQQVFSYLQEKRILSRFPKESVGVLPFMLVSFELGLSIILGYVAARFCAGSETNTRGRFPSLVFSFGKYGIHLHHWLLFLGMLLCALAWGFFVIAPSAFYGFLGGVVAQGIITYEDWPRIIFRKN